MKKKMLIFLGVILILFGALYFLNEQKNNKALEGSDNPYGKDQLHQETIDQLDDPLYQNQIIPSELDKRLEDNEDVTVYFYSPTCVYCLQTTPILAPLAEELDVDMKKVNFLEFKNNMPAYGIDGTPILVHYKNGKEVDRVNGAQSKDVYEAFFNEVVLNK